MNPLSHQRLPKRPHYVVILTLLGIILAGSSPSVCQAQPLAHQAFFEVTEVLATTLPPLLWEREEGFTPPMVKKATYQKGWWTLHLTNQKIHDRLTILELKRTWQFQDASQGIQQKPSTKTALFLIEEEGCARIRGEESDYTLCTTIGKKGNPAKITELDEVPTRFGFTTAALTGEIKTTITHGKEKFPVTMQCSNFRFMYNQKDGRYWPSGRVMWQTFDPNAKETLSGSLLYEAVDTALLTVVSKTGPHFYRVNLQTGSTEPI